jgi:predicted Zn-dependent peptidase
LTAPDVRRTRLANGIRLVSERMPDARSVTTGFWVAVGGRDEPAELAGASHFLEHLVFKGGEHQNARDIAESVDALGGEMNAFTSREHTAYYTRLPADDMAFGLELLTTVLAQPALRPHEIDAERDVILEELAMSEDTPDDKVHSLLADAVFPDHPLGREVLGDEATVAALTRDEINTFFGEHYRPANIVIAAAGRLDHDEVVEGVSHFLESVDAGEAPKRAEPIDPPKALAVEHRSTEQAHLTLGWRAPDQRDPDRFALAVANQAFGGGLSSRLFQEIREERGLAYSVYSAASLYTDIGLFMIYAGTAPSKVDEVLSLIDTEVAKIVADGITERELRVASGYLAGALLLNLEDSGSRMGRLARGELAAGEALTVDEQVERIRAVTLEDAHNVMQRILTGPQSLAAVGPFDESAFSART